MELYVATGKCVICDTSVEIEISHEADALLMLTNAHQETKHVFSGQFWTRRKECSTNSRAGLKATKKSK